MYQDLVKKIITFIRYNSIIEIIHFYIFTECFKANKFEQLMVNYANETIQNFSLSRIIKEEATLENFKHQDVIRMC